MDSSLKIGGFMKKILKLIGILYFSIINTVSCNAETKTGKPIFIDTRLMILVHPLFKAFDPKTGRFKGTSSEPFYEDKASRITFIQKVKDTSDYLLKSSENLKNKLKGVPFVDRISKEREFLTEKRTLEAKLEAMKARVYESGRVPINDGMTPYSSMYPQCQDLVETVKEICEELKKKYNTEVVIDIANILPMVKQKWLPPIVYNILEEAYKKDSNLSNEDLKIFIDNADLYWANKLGMDSDIIPYGAIDVRLEAIKLMEEKGKLYKLWDWEK